MGRKWLHRLLRKENKVLLHPQDRGGWRHRRRKEGSTDAGRDRRRPEREQKPSNRHRVPRGHAQGVETGTPSHTERLTWDPRLGRERGPKRKPKPSPGSPRPHHLPPNEKIFQLRTSASPRKTGHWLRGGEGRTADRGPVVDRPMWRPCAAPLTPLGETRGAAHNRRKIARPQHHANNGTYPTCIQEGDSNPLPLKDRRRQRRSRSLALPAKARRRCAWRGKGLT